MTRVSSFGHHQSMLNNLLANQARLMTAQEQVSSGKKASTYSGLGRDISPLMSAKTVKTQLDSHLNATNGVLDKLSFNDLYLNNIYDQTDSLRTTLLDGLSTEQFSSFDDELEQTFNTVVSALNAQSGGSYVFGGTRSDTKPVTVDSLADLAALPSVDDAFQNSDVKPSAQVDTGVNVEYGMLADEVGREAMASLKRIAEFQAGPDGPIDGAMTANQRAFIETEIDNLKTALRDVTASTVENGTRTAKMESLRDRHESADVVLKNFISDIENVDVAEAITRVQQNETALEASLMVVGQLSNLSLLDFI